jgi:hypothetical protein
MGDARFIAGHWGTRHLRPFLCDHEGGSKLFRPHYELQDIDRRAGLLVAAYRPARQQPNTTIIGEAS